MDNPNPIFYRDLITPDDSIQALIQQLTELISKYEEMRGKIQSNAADLAKSMQGVSGATDEQREVIVQTSKRAEEMADKYRRLTDEEVRLKAEQQEIISANREAIRVAKLQKEATDAAEGSYKRLSAQYRINKEELNKMSKAQREATPEGRKLEQKTKAIYEEMNRLQKATGKYTLQVGNYELALGKAAGVNVNFLSTLLDTSKASEAFHGILGALASPIGVIAGVVGTATGAFKIWASSIQDTQVTGDAFNVAMAGWNRTWDVFQKSVATFDFSNFISSALRAQEAAMNLAKVMDEAFERKWSIDIRREEAQPELQGLLEDFRDQRKTQQERIKAGQDYLDKIEGFYNEEKVLLDDIEQARLDDLFAATNRVKGMTAAEEEAAKNDLKNYIREYNITRDRVELANRYIAAVEGMKGAQKGAQEAMNATLGVTTAQTGDYSELMTKYQNIIEGTSDDIKALAEVVKQYNLSSDKELEAYNKALFESVRAASAFQTSTMRIRTQLHGLEAGEGRSTGGGRSSASWSLQSDATYMRRRLELLKQLQDGELESRQEFDRAIAELEIETLRKRLSRLKSGTSEYIKIETQLIEKEISLHERNAEAIKKEEDARNKDEQDAIKAATDYYNHQKEVIQLEIAGTEEGTEQMLMLRLELIEKEREIELKLNRTKTEDMRMDEALINAKYDRMALNETTKHAEKTVKTSADAVKKASKEVQKDKDIENLMQLFGIRLGSEDENEEVIRKRESAVITAVNSIKDGVSSLIDSWREAGKAAIEAADAQVDSAQKVVDSEREAAANGYANSVQRAERELALAKKQREEAQKEAERAHRAQLLMDTATQTSSLITASANIWKSLSGIPVVGPGLAVTALASMWASFAAARVKALQVTKETYGEGTVELLQGGSHASGHDISLGYTKDGKERRAEGGEFFAVINKRNSRRFRDVIPDVINSLNDGSFAERYQRAGQQLKGVAIQMMTPNLGRLEADVDAIRKQGEERRSIEDGVTIIRYKNLTRRIKS